MSGLLDQIERVVEFFGTAKEGIGDVLCRHLRREIEKMANFLPVLSRRELHELPIILSIHGEDEIEAGEIALLHLPGTLARDVDPAFARGMLCARVRRLADMPMPEPGRVDIEEVEHTLRFGGAAEGALGHRRAADIAEADEQNAAFCHAG